MGKYLGYYVGWGKVACWSTKAAISLKSVETEEIELLQRAAALLPNKRTRCHQLFTNALSNGTIPTSYGLLFPKIGESHFAIPPQTSIAIISGTDEATNLECRG